MEEVDSFDDLILFL